MTADDAASQPLNVLDFGAFWPPSNVGTVVRTLLFTDVVDSTKLAESLGDARMAAVWASHDRVARDLLPVLCENSAEVGFQEPADMNESGLEISPILFT